LLREYYMAGGRPASGAGAMSDHLQRLTGELETMRRVVSATLGENKKLRRLASTTRVAASPAREPLAAAR
jgi:hypothetical protein